jgi:hypothetical protein
MGDSEIFSKLAAGAYDTKGDRSAHTVGTDYILHPNKDFSDHSITTYVHKNDANHIVIAHRGTAPGSKGGREDLTSDLAFAAGLGGHTKRMKNRQAKTEQIIKATNPTTLHLTGHSLGGGTVNHTVANSKLVRSKMTSAHTFNAAANPVFGNRQNVGRQTRRDLKDKVTHHRIENDSVSLGFKLNTPFGKVKTYKHPKQKKRSRLARIAFGTFTPPTKKSLDAHAVSNFHP